MCKYRYVRIWKRARNLHRPLINIVDVAFPSFVAFLALENGKKWRYLRVVDPLLGRGKDNQVNFMFS